MILPGVRRFKMFENKDYDRLFHLKIGEKNAPGIVIGLKKENVPPEFLFEDVFFNTAIKYNYSDKRGLHYMLNIPYKDTTIEVYFKAHPHGVELEPTYPKIKATLEEIGDEKANEIYIKTQDLKNKILGSRISQLEKAIFEGT